MISRKFLKKSRSADLPVYECGELRRNAEISINYLTLSFSGNTLE
jgi:hypothetical protein